MWDENFINGIEDIDINKLDENGCPYCYFKANCKPKEIVYCTHREFYNF